MGVLNYTNIIGKSFSENVKGQLNARAKVLRTGIGGVERTNSDLIWLTNRNGWLRVTSNVDIKAGAEGGPLAKAYGSGADLAKKYVLQGGVAFADAALNNGSVLRSGVGVDKAYGVGFKPNSPGDMGLKPMPGITSFSISCDGPYGALKTANIKIKAYDLEQFNIMETLYCHLGYSLLVEFGHIPYINNDGVLQTQIQTLPIFNLSSKEDIAFEISKMIKKSCGNYDALFGTVTNYSWTANPDGSYDIDLKVIGPGSIVESLTINYTTSKINALSNPSQLPIYNEFLKKSAYKAITGGESETKPEGYDDMTFEQKVATIANEDQNKEMLPGIIASRNNSILHKHLFSIYENALVNNQVQNKLIDLPWYSNIGMAVASTAASVLTLGLVSPTTGDEDTPASDALSYSTDAATATNIFAQNQTYDFLKVSGNAIGGNIFAQKGNNSWLINHPDEASKIPNITPNLISYYVIAYLKSPDQETSTKDATNKDQLPQVYIPLGYFLAILQSSGMLYNSKKGDDKGKSTRPFIYIDFNDKTNYCYADDYTLSVDPSICLVDIAAKEKLMQTLFGGQKAINGDEIIPNTLSTIKSDNIYDPSADLLSPAIRNNNLGFYNTKTSGFLMHTLINLEYLVGKIDALAGNDVNKEVKIDKLLNDILVDVNNALGGVNQFRVAFDDDSYCIRLLDEQRINDGNGEPIPTIIDVLGLSSIVHNYSLTSKITPKLASMLIISAQASPGQSKAAATNASAVGKWNEYVKDRILPSKVDSTAGDEGGVQVGNPAEKKEEASTEEGAEDEVDTPDNQLSKHIKGIYCTFRYNAEDVEACRNTLSEKLKALQANREETEASQMIPLEFSIKMDGISGILVNQAFVIPPERLPVSYQAKNKPTSTKLGFIVRKIENTIENNQWITSISGQSLHLTNTVSAPITKIDVNANPLAGLSSTKITTGTQPKESLDPTAQKLDNEKTNTVTISGKNITTNTYTFLPKTSKKEVDVFIFYPGIDIGGKVGRDYMPQKIKSGAADWFDKYVLVFPTTWTTSYSSVKKEYEALLAKAGLTARTINIGIYSGSGNESASVLSAVVSAGKELRNFIMMDPVPSSALRNAITSVKGRGGTFQYLYYNPAAWGGADYYGGTNNKGELYGNIKTLVDLASTKGVGSKKTATGHYDIPGFMLRELKSQIEKNLG